MSYTDSKSPDELKNELQNEKTKNDHEWIPQEILVVIFSFFDLKSLFLLEIISKKFFELSKSSQAEFFSALSPTLNSKAKFLAFLDKYKFTNEYKRFIATFNKEQIQKLEKVLKMGFWERYACFANIDYEVVQKTAKDQLMQTLLMQCPQLLSGSDIFSNERCACLITGVLSFQNAIDVRPLLCPNGIRALSKGLITVEIAKCLEKGQKDRLKLLLSKYGLVALERKLISFDQIKRFSLNSNLSALLSESGVKALLEKLLTVNEAYRIKHLLLLFKGEVKILHLLKNQLTSIPELTFLSSLCDFRESFSMGYAAFKKVLTKHIPERMDLKNKIEKSCENLVNLLGPLEICWDKEKKTAGWRFSQLVKVLKISQDPISGYIKYAKQQGLQITASAEHKGKVFFYLPSFKKQCNTFIAEQCKKKGDKHFKGLKLGLAALYYHQAIKCEPNNITFQLHFAQFTKYMKKLPEHATYQVQSMGLDRKLLKYNISLFGLCFILPVFFKQRGIDRKNMKFFIGLSNKYNLQGLITECTKQNSQKKSPNFFATYDQNHQMLDFDLLFRKVVVGASWELCLLAERGVKKSVLARYIKTVMKDHEAKQSTEFSKPTLTHK